MVLSWQFASHKPKNFASNNKARKPSTTPDNHHLWNKTYKMGLNNPKWVSTSVKWVSTHQNGFQYSLSQKGLNMPKWVSTLPKCVGNQGVSRKPWFCPCGWLCRVELILRATPGFPTVWALVYRGCPCWDPPVCSPMPKQDGIGSKAPTLCALSVRHLSSCLRLRTCL